MSGFVKGVQTLKVKEVPAFVQVRAGRETAARGRPSQRMCAGRGGGGGLCAAQGPRLVPPRRASRPGAPLPPRLQKYAGENWTPAVVEGRVSRWLSNYKTKVRRRPPRLGWPRPQSRGGQPGPSSFLWGLQRAVCGWLDPHPAPSCPLVPPPPPPLRVQYIDTGSGKPLTDLIFGVFVGSYALSWPREYAHMKHEQEAKLKGEKH